MGDRPRRPYTRRVRCRQWIVLSVTAAAVLVGAGWVASHRNNSDGSSDSHDARGLSRAETSRVARFARNQARILGDPNLRYATVIRGPQTVRETGGERLATTQALIVLRGHFNCDRCHDFDTAALGLRRWHATTVGYTVYWPSLVVMGIGADDGPDGLNLPPANRIERLTTIKL